MLPWWAHVSHKSDMNHTSQTLDLSLFCSIYVWTTYVWLDALYILDFYFIKNVPHHGQNGICIIDCVWVITKY